MVKVRSRSTICAGLGRVFGRESLNEIDAAVLDRRPRPLPNPDAPVRDEPVVGEVALDEETEARGAAGRPVEAEVAVSLDERCVRECCAGAAEVEQEVAGDPEDRPVAADPAAGRWRRRRCRLRPAAAAHGSPTGSSRAAVPAGWHSRSALRSPSHLPWRRRRSTPSRPGAVARGQRGRLQFDVGGRGADPECQRRWRAAARAGPSPEGPQRPLRSRRLLPRGRSGAIPSPASFVPGATPRRSGTGDRRGRSRRCIRRSEASPPRRRSPQRCRRPQGGTASHARGRSRTRAERAAGGRRDSAP